MLIRKTQLLIFAVTLLCGGMTYGATQLLQPVGPSVWFIDPNYPTTNNNGAAGYVTGPPAWEIAQWGVPLSAVPTSGDISGWSIANQYERIQYYPQIDGGQNVYELAQAQDNTYCGNERDLFLAVSGGDPGTSVGYSYSDWLSQVGSLHVDVGVSVPWDQDNYRCPLNWGQFVYSIILSSSTGQYLYYQINLGRSPDPGHLTSVQWCPDYDLISGAHGYDSSFCLDDDVRNFLGGTWVTPYSNVVNSIDFLPRILQLLAAGHTKQTGIALDQDPSHWRTGAVYVGDIVQGDFVSTTRWYGLGLKNFPGGTFCNGTNNVQWVCFQGQPDGSGWVDVGGGCYHRNSGLPCN